MSKCRETKIIWLILIFFWYSFWSKEVVISFIIILLLCEFFTPALADCLQVKFRWQQFLLKSSRLFSVFLPILRMLYFKWSSLVLLFLITPSQYQSLVTVLSRPIRIDITVAFIFHSFLQFSSKVLVLISLFTFFFILLCGLMAWQRSLFGEFSFFIDYHQFC